MTQPTDKPQIVKEINYIKMTQQVEKSQISKEINYINLNPDTQSKIVDQILAQSMGVGLGIIVTLLSLVVLARWLGLNALITKWMEKLESDSQSFRSLANSVQNMSVDSKTHHNKYVEDHTKIIEEVREVREITKEILYKVDKQ
ncbi:hypothetical protein [Nostoc sp. ChiSLP03a]|uniref:hypothetical protein n=1 Tax=Nostoc sp. ChiSLP03a TaxID=3075380 RepID=UPI002AD55E8B|nr:hypothetical protein [Nostoc sp. ChiSLP03a]MDZ8215052.1 hypothetical protein [Nostoc sp. ChiSLP03a]